ncbi:MAG: hypothetical protein JSU68_09065 [Phycisphaerales bacterium]|nr:MAG: hypothetical protein JSU68_09065 [Phycisphaerales bacterium]
MVASAPPCPTPNPAIPANAPHQFTGRPLYYFEVEDGEETHELRLADHRRRHYDPLHGRWLQRDPLGTIHPLPGIAYGQNATILHTAEVMGLEDFLLWLSRVIERLALEETSSLQTNLYSLLQYHDGMNLYEYVRSNPGILVDPMGTDSRFWDFIKCMADCVEDNDPAPLAVAKILALIGGSPVPKTWVAALARIVGEHRYADGIIRSLKDPTVSKYTSIPSWLARKLERGPAKRILRKMGRYTQYIAVPYGLALLAIETHCTGWCCGTRHYTPEGNIFTELKRRFFD